MKRQTKENKTKQRFIKIHNEYIFQIQFAILFLQLFFSQPPLLLRFTSNVASKFPISSPQSMATRPVETCSWNCKKQQMANPGDGGSSRSSTRSSRRILTWNFESWKLKAIQKRMQNVSLISFNSSNMFFNGQSNEFYSPWTTGIQWFL